MQDRPINNAVELPPVLLEIAAGLAAAAVFLRICGLAALAQRHAAEAAKSTSDASPQHSTSEPQCAAANADNMAVGAT